MKRRPTNNRNFSRTAKRVHRRNRNVMVMRGGIRL